MENQLAQWLMEEINQRRMSIREFARFCGIGNQTLNNILDPKMEEDRYPTLKTLERLADATGTDICTLVALLIPKANKPTARARLLAERISRLPPEKQEIVDAYLLGILFQQQDKKE